MEEKLNNSLNEIEASVDTLYITSLFSKNKLINFDEQIKHLDSKLNLDDENKYLEYTSICNKLRLNHCKEYNNVNIVEQERQINNIIFTLKLILNEENLQLYKDDLDLEINHYYSNNNNLKHIEVKNSILNEYLDKNIDKYFKTDIEEKHFIEVETLKEQINELQESLKDAQNNQFMIEENINNQTKQERFNFESDKKYLIVSFNINKNLINDFPNVEIWGDDKKEKELKSKIKKFDFILLHTTNSSHTYENIIKSSKIPYQRFNSINDLNKITLN